LAGRERRASASSGICCSARARNSPFDFLDRFPNYGARLAGLNLALQFEEAPSKEDFSCGYFSGLDFGRAAHFEPASGRPDGRGPISLTETQLQPSRICEMPSVPRRLWRELAQ
jgi:hypothetical protein